MKQGIYVIRNTLNGRCYVGSSVDIDARLCRHFSLLRSGKHHSPALQNSYSSHPDRLESAIVEIVSEVSDLIAREQLWIDRLKAYGFGYNGKPLAGKTQLGRKHSPEERARMKAGKTGKPSPMKGLTRSLEFRAKCSAWQKGRKLPLELVKRMADARRGIPCPPEKAAKIAAAQKGKRLSPEHRANSRAAQLRYYAARRAAA